MATISFFASHLISDKKKLKLTQIFEHLDTNNDGRLSKDEILIGIE